VRTSAHDSACAGLYGDLRLRCCAASAGLSAAACNRYPVYLDELYFRVDVAARNIVLVLMPQLTPFSTVGPFFKLLVRDRPEGTDCLVSDATRGGRITISGRLIAGNGAAVDDGLVETWQADADGHYHHADDPHRALADPAFAGFGRAATGTGGAFVFRTVRPGVVRGPHGQPQAPHILVGVMARGVMSRCWTRIYFEGEPLNATDPILQLVPAERRDTLIARRTGDGEYEFDIVLQGAAETVFFDA
jgi:protocatechuate 3,4-dioxygenase alpha subunit